MNVRSWSVSPPAPGFPNQSESRKRISSVLLVAGNASKPRLLVPAGRTSGGGRTCTLGRDAFGSFVAGVPPPMVIGSVTLDDGRVVKSFLCEPYALEGSEEITSFGGFRAFLAKRAGDR